MIAAWGLFKRVAPGLILAGLVIGLLVAAYGRGARVATERLTATHQAELAAIRADLATAKADAEAQAREVERQHREAMTQAENDFQQANDDATKRIAALDAAVRAGDVRLRERFTCPAQPAGTATQAVPGTGGSDAAEGRGLRQEDASFLVRLSDEADAVVRQLHACQAIVRKDRGQ